MQRFFDKIITNMQKVGDRRRMWVSGIDGTALDFWQPVLVAVWVDHTGPAGLPVYYRSAGILLVYRFITGLPVYCWSVGQLPVWLIFLFCCCFFIVLLFFMENCLLNVFRDHPNFPVFPALKSGPDRPVAGSIYGGWVWWMKVRMESTIASTPILLKKQVKYDLE
jgi:hypothetical protein